MWPKPTQTLTVGGNDLFRLAYHQSFRKTGACHSAQFPGLVPDTGPPFEAGFVFLG
jgi:hypothetical protein